MEIYVVKPGDTIYSIAEKYGVSASRLIQDNGIENPMNLVIGQSIIITFPQQLYTVQEGDTLAGIANSHGITIMQLLRNNSFLSDRQFIYPGETLVISYNTTDRSIVNGYVYPYINNNILNKTLPYLTYLSVFNYRVLAKGNIVSYRDDKEIVQAAIRYGVVPLLMIGSVSFQGEYDIETVNEYLINTSLHEPLISNLLDLLKTTEYKGINVLISGMKSTNQELYINLFKNISIGMRNEGYQVFCTIDTDVRYVDGTNTYEEIDYSRMSPFTDGISFLQIRWANNNKPPMPVCSIDLLNSLLDYAVKLIQPDKISMGIPLIGFDWELPYILDKTVAHSMTLNSAIVLARDVGTVIQFDEISQTPFYKYVSNESGAEINHIVWFIDIRSINAFDQLISQYHLSGFDFWNIMIFNQQIWSLIISKYEIVKLLPDYIS